MNYKSCLSLMMLQTRIFSNCFRNTLQKRCFVNYPEDLIVATEWKWYLLVIWQLYSLKNWEVKEYGIFSERKQWIHKSDGIDSGENWMKAYNPWLYFQQLSLVTWAELKIQSNGHWESHGKKEKLLCYCMKCLEF